MINPPLAAYLHFPWCVAKCPYCDFNSHPLKGSLREEEYVDALLANINAAIPEMQQRPVQSVFFGGGTPSLFAPASFERLICALHPYLAEDAELTLEANPGTTEYHNLGGYRDAGITRLSFGAQSFDAQQLIRLGRIHSPEETRRAVAAAHQAGFDNINLDLMYGLPDQTTAAAVADLDAALELEPTHLSWYQLTIEPRTEFARHPPLLPMENELLTIEAAGLRRLGQAGFQRYEVSAFARNAEPGIDYRSRHNLNYWTFGDYLGFGAGAHGKLTEHGSSYRTRRPRQPRLYLDAPQVMEIEAISETELPGEFLMGALRLVQGITESEYETRTGLSLSSLEPTRQRFIELGLMHPNRLQATTRGYALLNSLVQEFL